MAQRVEHWFNRRYGVNRRDVYVLRTEPGGRCCGADGREVAHYLDDEAAAARAMVRRMREAVPPELSNWALMSPTRRTR